MIYWRHNRCGVVLALIIGLHTLASAQTQESWEGFISGIRANAVKGEVLFQRDQGKFNLEPGVSMQEGDLIRTAANSYAELTATRKLFASRPGFRVSDFERAAR